MITFKNTEVFGFRGALEGMRLPMASEGDSRTENGELVMGEKDKALAARLANAGPDHGKFMRMIHVQTTITAPLYWVAEHDTYKVGTVRNSASFMHKGLADPFNMDQFDINETFFREIRDYDPAICLDTTPLDSLEYTIDTLNFLRRRYLMTRDEYYFQQIRHLLPSGWKTTYKWDANYQVLRTIYHQRKNHRLPEWKKFCEWIEGLPYSWLITGEDPA